MSTTVATAPLTLEFLFRIDQHGGPLAIVDAGGVQRVAMTVAKGTFCGPRLSGTKLDHLDSGEGVIGSGGVVHATFRQILRTDDGADIWMSGTTRIEITESRATAASAGIIECSDGRYAWLAGSLFAGEGGVDLASGSGQWDVYRVTHGR